MSAELYWLYICTFYVLRNAAYSIYTHLSAYKSPTIIYKRKRVGVLLHKNIESFIQNTLKNS